jgi:hypothetical protein
MESNNSGRVALLREAAHLIGGVLEAYGLPDKERAADQLRKAVHLIGEALEGYDGLPVPEKVRAAHLIGEAFVGYDLPERVVVGQEYLVILRFFNIGDGTATGIGVVNRNFPSGCIEDPTEHTCGTITELVPGGLIPHCIHQVRYKPVAQDLCKPVSISTTIRYDQGGYVTATTRQAKVVAAGPHLVGEVFADYDLPEEVVVGQSYLVILRFINCGTEPATNIQLSAKEFPTGFAETPTAHTCIYPITTVPPEGGEPPHCIVQGYYMPVQADVGKSSIKISMTLSYTPGLFVTASTRLTRVVDAGTPEIEATVTRAIPPTIVEDVEYSFEISFKNVGSGTATNVTCPGNLPGLEGMTILSNTCISATLAPGAQCSVSGTYKPPAGSAHGLKKTSFTLYHNEGAPVSKEVSTVLGRRLLIAVGRYACTKLSYNGTAWQSSSSSMRVYTANSVAWSETLQLFVLGMSSFGALYWSKDAVTWNSVSGSFGSIAQIIWNPDREEYVAVSSQASRTPIYTSKDGLNWTPRTSPETMSLTGIVWRSKPPQEYVAVGFEGGAGFRGAILTSSDGITWIYQVSSVPGDLSSVTWAEGLNRYVASTSSVSTSVLYSDNGTNWIQTADAALPRNAGSITVGYGLGGEIYVVGGRDDEGCAVATSRDGVRWTKLPITSPNSTFAIIRVTWSALFNKFYAVGFSSSTLASVLYTSSAGIVWDSMDTGSFGSQQTLEGGVYEGVAVPAVVQSVE